jgi:sugar (pentulose or hexulose) kinase
VILFAVGGDIEKLDPERDTLANVSALGDPVACARFMGGREFEILTGGVKATPTDAELNRVLSEGIMALPTFVAGCGPFPRSQGRWTVDAGTLTPGERHAAASLYLALMTAESLILAGAAGPTIVEGPFSGNPIFCGALASLTGRSLQPSDSGTGTLLGALMTATGKLPKRAAEPALARPLDRPALLSYLQEWRRAAGL